MKNFGQDGRCPGLNQVSPEYKLPFFSLFSKIGSAYMLRFLTISSPDSGNRSSFLYVLFGLLGDGQNAETQ
jgi:hypothetical protein